MARPDPAAARGGRVGRARRAGQGRASAVAGERDPAVWNRRLIAALADHADGRSALTAVCDAVREMLPCDRVQIWRGDVRQMTMRTVVASGYPGEDASRLESLVAPMLNVSRAHDFLATKCFFVPDANAEPDAFANVAFTAFGLEAVGLFLLERGERPIGALQLSWRRAPEAHMPDAEIGEAIRRHASVGLDFLARTEDALGLAETLTQTAIVLGSLHDPEELLRATAATIAEAVGCDWATLHMAEEDELTLRRVAQHGLPPAGELARAMKIDPETFAQALAALEDGVFEVPDVSQAPRYALRFGPTRPASYFSVPLMHGGQLVCVLTLGYHERTGRFARRQITLAKGLAHHALTALRSASAMQSLREASQAKTDFIATVSHDLRTPLHVLIGYSEMLLEGAVGELAAQQADLVERIRAAALRFRDLINDIVDVARLDAGQGAQVLAPVSLPALCEDLRIELEMLVRPEVELRFAADDLAVLGDAAKIKVVLRNLVSNAIKFTRAGEVEVSARLIGGRELVLRVRDTGPGIGAHDRARVFEMFAQGDAGRRAGSSGLGLGLYLVKRLAGLLGGSVSLESAEPGNTVFEVRLPVRSFPDPPGARQ